MTGDLFGLKRWWDRFFFQPTDLSICGLLRIGYAILLLVLILVWFPDLERWFGEEGYLPFAASRDVVDSNTLTLFAWLPKTNTVLWTCYFVLLAQTVALLLGWCARFQAFCIFIWLVSLQHRNMLVFDAEDWLFRLLAFYMIFLPIGEYYSLFPGTGKNRVRDLRPVWPLRLIQIQISMVYVSSAWEKLNGAEWRNGTALYYVSRLDDLFGRFPVPEFLFQSLPAITCLTWAVLAMEIFIPLGLWFKDTRRIALWVALVFHLMTDYAMNLFLFHPIMLVALIAFVDPQDIGAMKEKWRALKMKLARSG